MTDESDKIQSAREEALAEISDVIEQAKYKSLGSGRIRSPEKERIRLKYLRLVISANDTRRQYLKDRDLEELAERITKLENNEKVKARN